ncbi:hypothetical protein ROZALSC1DRAFT_31336 [Rozella allomycis CSF55]|uniref:Tudor domain-containing protein n=1 Tax=Rozella allomycis (strain CSF55) TaxID=988480 RepID=A0A4P9YC14_ROZAC|nr:hypothetical protein ROZALSC1DRAFT_31336 [Rozella allomycis CSF55]
MEEDLKNYEYQLDQVSKSLELDPDNAELLDLKTSLLQVIELTKQLLPSAPKENSSSVPRENKKIKNADFKVGDIIEARYSADGRWYEATIQTMAADRSIFTVLFNGYDDTQNVTSKDIRPLSKQALERRKAMQEERKKNPVAAAAPDADTKKQGTVKKKSTYMSYIKSKEKEHAQKQQSWQKFNAKAGSMKKFVTKKEASVSQAANTKSRHSFNYDQLKNAGDD